MFAVPIMLVTVYNDFREKAQNNVNMLFFVWSLAFVSFLAAILMFGYDIYTIVKNIPLYLDAPYQESFHDIFTYFVMFAVVLVAAVFFDLLFMILGVLYIRQIGENAFPIPELFRFIKEKICCICMTCRPPNEAQDQDNQWRRFLQRFCCSECLVLLFGSVSFTLFLQLSSFHSLYILLGAISTPVDTLSITAFYMACFFCLFAFIAIVLKSTHNQAYYNKFECVNAIKCVVFVLAAGLFSACIVLFVIYFYNYTR